MKKLEKEREKEFLKGSYHMKEASFDGQ